MKPADLAAIGRYFFPPDQPDPAEIALVFGMNAPERPVQLAIRLYQTGAVRRLLFTGGPNQRLGRPEAEQMADLALAAGIPAAAILVEPQATHTDDNAALSARLLARQGGLAGLDRLLLVTIHYHLRRAILAVQRWFPPALSLSWACYPSHHYTAENWFQTARGRHNVQREIAKIAQYYSLTLTDLLESTR